MKKTLFLFFFLIALISCNQTTTSSLPNYSGRSGEIIVVSTQAQWDGLIGDSIHSILRSFQYGLPQSEPYFDLINTSKKNFEKVFKTFRNVLIVDIDKNRMSKGEIRFHKNAYAKEQFLATVAGSDRKEILELLSKNKSKLIRYFNNKELNRLIKKNQIKGDKELNQQVQDHLGISMITAEDAYIAKTDSNLLWLRTENKRKRGGFEHQISQGILIYSYPYTDTTVLNSTHILKVRDEFLQKNVPGSKVGSYVTTDYKYVPPQVTEFSFDGHYAKEIRGLWEMKSGYMGGPMYSLTILDEKKSRVMNLIGYVYAPEFDKRELLREIESVIKSVKLETKKPLSF